MGAFHDGPKVFGGSARLHQNPFFQEIHLFSKLFMFYQLFGMISAILAPATICLMVAGSLSFLLNIPAAVALVISVIPPAIYLGLCFKLKADTQITIAAVLSILYAFLMMRSEDEQLSIRQDNLNPEPTQPEPQPQNTIVDDASDNEQEEEETVIDSPVQCWKSQLESLSSDIQLQEGFLDEDENQFWKELIERYLKPLQNDKEKQEQIKNDLQDLRNKKDTKPNADSSSASGTNMELTSITQEENEVEMSDEPDSEAELSEWDIGEWENEL
ncbi:hypothetical protein CRENBAI_011784 [Crenichthys baileyi]|uniref:Uncharacterized protein n=1 Tax=Crenichthys baileyi TaxID=28760 RepID=A0AAV9RU13_9TELE